jgi:hypothetical protein
MYAKPIQTVPREGKRTRPPVYKQPRVCSNCRDGRCSKCVMKTCTCERCGQKT